ncbi:MAG: hypothetical protein GX996_01875 [Firmicutes bacterium]|nr:hypothetical protein [Bacillota bacterium]
MGTRDRRKIQRALLKKGFQRSDNDHAKFTYLTLSGEKTNIWTKTSYGSKHKDLSDNNISNMARQCRLSKRDFMDLVKCPMTREKYEILLLSAGEIASGGDKV